MGFTKEMSEENKAMLERATQLLDEYEWSKEAEVASRPDNSWSNPYTVRMGDRITEQLMTEFSTVTYKRIRSRAFHSMVIARSRELWER